MNNLGVPGTRAFLAGPSLAVSNGLEALTAKRVRDAGGVPLLPTRHDDAETLDQVLAAIESTNDTLRTADVVLRLPGAHDGNTPELHMARLYGIPVLEAEAYAQAG